MNIFNLNILTLKSRTPRWIIILLDVFLSLFSLFVAYIIRFDLKADQQLIMDEWNILKWSLPVFILVRWVIFYVFKVHSGLVRYTSYNDLSRIFTAVTLSSLIYFILGMVRYHFMDEHYLFPTSVLIMDYFICLFFIIGVRFTIKLWYLETIKVNTVTEKVLIYGAGTTGVITQKTISNDAEIKYEIVGFLDDDLKLEHTRREGTKIYHASKLKELIEKEGVTLLIVAVQKPNEDQLNEIVNICLEHQVKVQKAPSFKSWINGEFSSKQITKINIEDLLGRKAIVLDEEKTAQELKNKTILVTGAAGSIGSGMVLQIAKYAPKKIILLDQAESPMYDFQQELNNQFPDLSYEVVIADIRSMQRMTKVFKHYQPEFVFHAAAYKHVPLMEDNPSEAILTNVKGTRNLVQLAVEGEVEKFVMISTDKAVNPTNVMGASKRIAEMIAQYSNGLGTTKFITTRFGNVLGSNGSVIPLFQKQIAKGGPITVTDERITRFFMTIPEACQLVLEAGTMGQGGEIFVFDMGESVKIVDLAKKMIRLHGLTLGKDIEIKFTGLRPGEKLYEELLAKDEDTIPTHHPKILKAKLKPVNEAEFEEISNLIQLFDSQDNLKIVQSMKKIVPEFISNNSAYEKLDR